MARAKDLLTHRLGVGLDQLSCHFLCFGDLIGGHSFGYQLNVSLEPAKNKYRAISRLILQSPVFD